MFTDKFHPATMPSVHHIQHLKLKISNSFDSVDKNDNFDNDNGDNCDESCIREGGEHMTTAVTVSESMLPVLYSIRMAVNWVKFN